MNLLVKKLWSPVVLLLVTITIISCEDPGRIGLVINENTGLLKTGFKEIVLPTSVVQFNPRKTTGSASFKAGTYSDPDFGVVDYKHYTQLQPSLVIQPNQNAVYDKFTMSIGFTDITGPVPDNNRLNYIAINQLDEPIDSTVNYVRTDELMVKQVLGEWSFIPYVDDTLRTDSTYVIELASAVGTDLFQKLKDGDPIFDNAKNFNEYFNGISFEAGSDIMNIFELDRSKVSFTIHYFETNSEGNQVEREYRLSLGGGNFHHISADYSATALSGITPDNMDFFPSDDFRYMQSGTMLAIKVDLAPFHDLTDTIDYMVINKAEVLFEDVQYSSEYLRPPNGLLTYFTNDTNEWPVIDYFGRVDSTNIGEQFVALQDQSLDLEPGFYGFPQIVNYFQDSSSYNVNVSTYLQNLYVGNYSSVTQPFVEEHGLIYLFTETSVLFPTFSPSHTETVGFKVHKDNIKLRIYYSYPRYQQTNN